MWSTERIPLIDVTVGRDTLSVADARGRRAPDTQRSGVHLTPVAAGVGTRLLREASTILTRISTQTEPLGRPG